MYSYEELATLRPRVSTGRSQIAVLTPIGSLGPLGDASRGGRRHVIDALACVEDVSLAEMWSQGVFIDRRHGLAVVVLVLQS